MSEGQIVCSLLDKGDGYALDVETGGNYLIRKEQGNAEKHLSNYNDLSYNSEKPTEEMFIVGIKEVEVSVNEMFYIPAANCAEQNKSIAFEKKDLINTNINVEKEQTKYDSKETKEKILHL
jgi:hypothetical protein